jgi:ElaB/YqjD/DUF883 family membrane-anchored ribosome-binding protein
MTEAHPPASGDVASDFPYATPTDLHGTSERTDGGDGQGKAGAAKEQAAAVGQGAAQAGQQVASTAKDEAQNVVAETGSQAKDLLHQARSELSDQAGSQQQRLAAGLRSLGDELDSMTQHSEQSGTATKLAKEAASRSRSAATWLESREPSHVMRDVQDFARQRPGMFLALAAGAGVIAGRLGRGIKDAGSDEASSTPSSSDAATGVDAPYAPYASSFESTGTYETTGRVESAGRDDISYVAPADDYAARADETAPLFPPVENLGDEQSRVDRDVL